ncbi:PD-(D/E)XK nuclease family protein [Qipengyuania nanhaisediminis]|uniref:PD-(D/E)XK nuclease family protein n=1 Tax=Qipengyuania nanhaisediminis TaxID=604088 RepID=UPI0038B411A6
MGDRAAPEVYSIAAHRGFADALVAGLVPRYAEPDVGLARLTLLVPSARAARTISEAFIRHAGANDAPGLLMPRMVTVGDLDLDETLGALLDPLGASTIPPAVEPTRRWLELAELIESERADQGLAPLPATARLRLAGELARTMDRLLVEDVDPADLVSEGVLNMLADLAQNWRNSLRLFVGVQDGWFKRLEALGAVDAATRRNLLFERAARAWRDNPPGDPIVAAGVTSASPALARMLRAIANLPNGAVILPDLDLSMAEDAWNELGRAGQSEEPGGEVFGAMDALTHPQYHLKLLLGRMGIARNEVKPWHRRGEGAAAPERSHAISALFLPPRASRSWVGLEPHQRRLSGVRLMTLANAEEEAQAIALLVRRALAEPEKRVALVTADRSLARRVTQHLSRWNIAADDSAGQPLSLTAAGRLFGLVAEIAARGPEPTTLIGALAHPLVAADDDDRRRAWLRSLRTFDRALRGPTPAPGLESLRKIARTAGVGEWWEGIEQVLAPLGDAADDIALAEAIEQVARAAEALAGDNLWAREDGRALAAMVEDLRLHASAVDTRIALEDIATILRDCMEAVAVRPPYGGHPRVAIYGLLESRMARADLMICGGLNEGSWPQGPAADSLLAPAVLRKLGVPGAEFRIGLSAHDLAGVLGAPEVVLSRARRDSEGPTLPSRFLLRIEALLGELADKHRETQIPAMLGALDRDVERAEEYERPEPRPSPEQRKVELRVTALDRLLGDPYQFYANSILQLSSLNPLAADPYADPALRGTLVHDILDAWHKARETDPGLAIVPFATEQFAKAQVHPLFKGLWQPRLLAAFERFETMIEELERDGRTVLVSEASGAMMVRGIKVKGRADRIDRLADGTLAIVDYKTGQPPKPKAVAMGYALQLGLLGLIARDGSFCDGKVSGDASRFEYWSLAKDGETIGFRKAPLKVDGNKSGLLPEKFLPKHEEMLARALDLYLLGDAPFRAKENPDYPGYDEYDQLMRLEEWAIRMSRENGHAGTAPPEPSARSAEDDR